MIDAAFLLNPYRLHGRLDVWPFGVVTSSVKARFAVSPVSLGEHAGWLDSLAP